MTQRIGFVQVDAGDDGPASPRSPERQALAAVLVKRDAILAALRENEAQRHRVAKARIAAFVHIDVATEAIETAMVADAAAVAEGRPGGAVKAARTALQDARDSYEAAKAAETMLADQHKNLTNRLELTAVNAAVAAVVHNAPELHTLIEKFRASQLAMHEMRETMRVLAPYFPHVTNNAWWESSGLPSYFRFWDAVDWQRDLPPSQTASHTEEWIAALKTNGDAVLVA